MLDQAEINDSTERHAAYKKLFLGQAILARTDEDDKKLRLAAEPVINLSRYATKERDRKYFEKEADEAVELLGLLPPPAKERSLLIVTRMYLLRLIIRAHDWTKNTRLERGYAGAFLDLPSYDKWFEKPLRIALEAGIREHFSKTDTDRIERLIWSVATINSNELVLRKAGQSLWRRLPKEKLLLASFSESVRQ